jgi:hypothetical protein
MRQGKGMLTATIQVTVIPCLSSEVRLECAAHTSRGHKGPHRDSSIGAGAGFSGPVQVHAAHVNVCSARQGIGT